MTKIKVQIDGGFPVTFIGRYSIGSAKQGDGKSYPVLVVHGKVPFGKEDRWTFYAPICTWKFC